MHKPQQRANRQHPSKPAVSNGKPAHVSQDFPFANARGVCIKCGDGWLIGVWQRHSEYDLLPMGNGSRLDKKFDELAGKQVCDSCHKKYPPAQHMFQTWKPEVTEKSVKLVSQRAARDYIDPAKAAATMFALSHSSGNSGSSSSSNSSVSSDSSASDLQNDTETVIATVLDGIFDAACSSVIKHAESANVVHDVLKNVVHAVYTQTASQDRQARQVRHEHARAIVASVIGDVFTEIDERARLHQLTTWYDMGKFKYTTPANSGFRSGQGAPLDFKCWARVGPICDALNAMPILASDVSDFFAEYRSFGGNGILDSNCVLISRPVNQNGIRTGQRVPGPTLITADHVLSPLLTWPR